MKFNRIILAFAILLIPSLCLAQNPISLEDAISRALESNYAIKISKNQTEIAGNNVNIGNAGMLPKLEVTGNGSYAINNSEVSLASGQRIVGTGAATTNYGWNVQLSWTLFDGFNMFITYDKFKQLEEQSKIEFQIQVENNIRTLLSNYYEALRLKENLDIIKETIRISSDRIRRIRDKMEFGSASSIELLKAQVNYNSDSSLFMQTMLNYETFKHNLNFLMGNSIDADISLFSNYNLEELPDLNKLREAAFAKNSTINQSIKSKELSELDLRSIKAQFEPRINFTSSYNNNFQENEAAFVLNSSTNGYTVGINASFNLFDGFKNSIQKENAMVNIKISEERIEQAKKQIDLNLMNNYRTYQHRLNILKLEQENLKIANLNFERSDELFKLGQMSSLEYREAQLNKLRAEFAVTKALVDAKLSSSELMLIIGEMPSN